ncbi:uncharacterized protein LOC121399734 [Xenopus laevis]|uniref:Uncharacterized protein LOC121399734 n=1 Tax=Xenopus laevis TaxID=8355 RepID=A0A8J1M6B5_XENLA|nr:uncharacterized protein LOC121399734 [Xenopus laevis]
MSHSGSREEADSSAAVEPSPHGALLTRFLSWHGRLALPNVERTTLSSYASDNRIVVQFYLVKALVPEQFVGAMKTRNLNVLQTHLTLKPGTRSLVPCKFLPVHPIDMTKIKLEWGKLSLEEGKYTPLIQLNSEGIRRHPEIDHRFGLFVPLVKKGNCTLIIDSIDAKDTGVYEVWMALDGRLHEAYPKTKTTISDQKQASGASRANVKLTVMATSIMSTTAETASNQTDYFVMLLDDKHGRTTIIVVIAVLSILSVSALITTIMW